MAISDTHHRSAPPHPGASWYAGELLRSSALSFDGALLAIASAYEACDPAPLLDALDSAARSLFHLDRSDCRTRARGIGNALTDRLGLTTDEDDPCGLLITTAMRSHRAHPIVIAALGCEIARRAGIRTHLCQSDTGWWTAVMADDNVALVGNRADAPPPRTGTLRAACPHQMAGALLERLAVQTWRPHIAGELLDRLPACGADSHDDD